MSEIIIDSTRVIKTPEGISRDGLLLSGKCLVIEGGVVQNIEYLAAEQCYKVYAEHFIIPFNSHIILPKEFKTGTPLTTSGYLEEIFTEIQDSRTIYENISILFAAEY